MYFKNPFHQTDIALMKLGGIGALIERTGFPAGFIVWSEPMRRP